MYVEHSARFCSNTAGVLQAWCIQLGCFPQSHGRLDHSTLPCECEQGSNIAAAIRRSARGISTDTCMAIVCSLRNE